MLTVTCDICGEPVLGGLMYRSTLKVPRPGKTLELDLCTAHDTAVFVAVEKLVKDMAKGAK